ncbi:MAG: hypothetical protein Kow00103_01620 [Candidatus Caldatribacteriota bacterium]
MLPKKSLREDKFDNSQEYEHRFSEKEICKAFLKEYNKKIKGDFRFYRMGDPNKKEPTCLCSDNLNLEVAPVYYNQEEAKATWGLVKKMKKREKEKGNKYKNKEKKDYLAEATQMFCDYLNERINSKNENNYNYSGKIILIIEEGIGLTEKEAVEYYLKQGKRFTNKIFQEIWLMLQSAGHYRIYQLV